MEDYTLRESCTQGGDIVLQTVYLYLEGVRISEVEVMEGHTKVKGEEGKRNLEEQVGEREEMAGRGRCTWADVR